MAASWKEMLGQLHRLPGGAAAAIPDFFAGVMSGPEETDAAGLPCWPLREGGALCLVHAPGGGGLRLVHDAATLAELPADLLAAIGEDAQAAASGVSPLVLALLAIASGEVDDGRRLKKALPRVDGAAKDLMLMTVCRLCG